MDTWLKVLAVVIPVLLAIGGLLWALIRRGLETIEKHGERIAVLENDVKHLSAEVGKVREVRHEILDGVTKKLAEWYIAIMQKIGK